MELRQPPRSEAVALRDLTRLRDVLEELTGLQSRWNDDLRTREGVEYFGQLGWDNTMHLRTDFYASPPERWWRTLIHESLHGVSRGAGLQDYRLNRLYEEGVAEGAQRALRQAILAQIGDHVPEEAFRSDDEQHGYNAFVHDLEAARTDLAMAPEAFYLWLLRTPLGLRRGAIATRRAQMQQGGHP